MLEIYWIFLVWGWWLWLEVKYPPRDFLKEFFCIKSHICIGFELPETKEYLFIELSETL